MKKERTEVQLPSSPLWMTTFSDMSTLLLTFFILIVSYSTIELEKFRGAMSSMKGALGVMPDLNNSQRSDNLTMQERLAIRYQSMSEKMADIRNTLQEAKVENQVKVEMQETGIHIRFVDHVLYDLGKADLKQEAYPILSKIIRTVQGSFKEILVEGHTDDIPINTQQFPSNWELSSARALNVVRYFHDVEKISASRLAAVGHGEYRPLVPNDHPDNRSKNRRVEIFIKWD